MAGALGNLLIMLTADTGQATSDIGKAAHQVERDMQTMATKATAAGLLIGQAIGQIALKFGQLAVESVTMGDQLAKMSQRSGFAVERLSELKFAGDLADVSFQQLGQGLSQFEKNLVDANKAGSKASEVFIALGVDITKGPQAAFEQMAKAINSLPDGELKSATMRAAFGRAGDALIPMMAGLDDATEKARKLGLVMSEQMARDSERFNDAMTTLGAATKMLVANALTPTVSVLAEMSNQMVLAASRGEVLKGVIYELGRVAAATFGGIARLFGDEKAEDDAFNKFNALTMRPDGTMSRSGPAASVNQAALRDAVSRVGGEKAGKKTKAEADIVGRQLAEGMAEEARIMSEVSQLVDDYNRRVREAGEAAVQSEMDAQVARAESIIQMQEIIDQQDRMANGWDENGKKISESTQKASNFAKELGLTFTSAFEDAVIAGKKLSDVLRALAQDIAKMVLRKQVTEPIAKGIGGLLEGIFKADGGPVSGGQPYIVGERGPELFVPGMSGSIVPNHALGGGGVTIVQHINIDSRTDQASIMQAMGVAKQQAKAEIMESLNRGSDFARATGRA